MEACKRRAHWLWTHRTKTIGALGVAVGSAERYLQDHPDVHLPGRGMLLIGFGVIVFIVGTYNSLAQFFGWTDPPS